MKIKETFVSHTGLVDVGRFSFFIDAGRDGAYIEKSELVKNAMIFPRVVLIGKPFEQKNEVANFCKALFKESPDIKIEINTAGTIKPIGIPNIDNIIYNVYIPLKISGIEYSERIKTNIINWFVEIKANFIFNVNIEDEVDEVSLIVQENNISKRNVYLSFDHYEHFDNVRLWAKHNGYNFAPDFKKLLWKDDGRT